MVFVTLARFLPLRRSPFTVQPVVAAAAVEPALGCVGPVGEMSADDAASVTDADGASQDDIQSRDSRSGASSARSSPSRACTSGPGSDADGFEAATAVDTSQRDCKPHVYCSCHRSPPATVFFCQSWSRAGKKSSSFSGFLVPSNVWHPRTHLVLCVYLCPEMRYLLGLRVLLWYLVVPPSSHQVTLLSGSATTSLTRRSAYIWNH